MGGGFLCEENVKFVKNVGLILEFPTCREALKDQDAEVAA
ncbi:MAG: hypothetical protein ACJARO_000411 [Bacteriovoracaceae bacterium]|jgi:hypothetical protein